MGTDAATLPQVTLGPHSVSRLIAGSNTVMAGSHLTQLMNAHMREYFTLAQTVAFLGQCAEQGINTWQGVCRPPVVEALTQFRASGGEMQFVCLCPPQMVSDEKAFADVLALDPIGIAFHGEYTDRIFRKGEIDSAKETLARIRDAGVQVGLSTHNPEVIEYIEEKDWDLDFYMACVYRKSRDRAELMPIMKEVPIGEVYLPSDFPRMCEAIRKASRPCLAFKILAAGRTCEKPEQVRAAFAFAYENIKPTDAVIVGMYPRYTDQVRENADLVREFGQVDRL